MQEILSQLFDLAKRHGWGDAGTVWIIVLASVAWLAGKAGIGAVKFVRGLLETSSALRQQIVKELGETRALQAKGVQRITKQAEEIALLRIEAERLRERLRECEHEIEDLHDALRRARTEGV